MWGAMIPSETIESLAARHEAVLLDAYGVLVDSEGALPGAAEAVAYLNRAAKPYLVVTNDASRSAKRSAERYQSFGLAIPEARVLTSGSLLPAYFRARGLVGAGCAVLGPEDSVEYVREAGGIVCPLFSDDVSPISVLVIGDESGFPFLEGVDWALTLACTKADRGDPLELVVPNPDLMYPKPSGVSQEAGSGPGRKYGGEQDVRRETSRAFGLAAGSIAGAIEAALRSRFPDRPGVTFARLGKPHAPIFEEALKRLGTRDAVMIGDQIETDIRGAKAAGIKAALVASGVTASTVRLEALRAEERPDAIVRFSPR